MTQIIIAIPESERQTFLAAMATIEDQANAYTSQCIKILVEQHGAIEAGIKREIFYHKAVGQLAQGKELGEPAERVKEALSLYKAKYLGMEA